MLTEIVSACDRRHTNKTGFCLTCTYRRYCPNNCGRCLHFIHTPTATPTPRKYDCIRMADYYVCKYAHKYTSELYWALDNIKDLKDKPSLKVLSIGCGPCTDLFSLNLLQQNGEYHFENLEYIGIDINLKIWKRVLSDIRTFLPAQYTFKVIEADICSYIDTIVAEQWHPDIIILQYVFSDIQKNNDEQVIAHLIQSLGRYIRLLEVNAYIVCNDINLSTRWNGGREYFDQLQREVDDCTDYRTLHFNNSNKQSHFEYGSERSSNRLAVDIPSNLNKYEPYTSCASAQMIIKKVR